MNGMQPTHAQKWKIKALSELIKAEETKIPFIVVTESHFKPAHKAAEVSISGYNVQRADRTTRKNGGVALYYAENLVSNDSITYSDDYCQSVTLYIKNLNLIIAGVYRPPNARDDQVNSFRKLIQQLNDFMMKYPTAEVQIYGDFNMKFMQWQYLSLKPGHGLRNSEQLCAEVLINFMQENFLSQLVSENTRNDQSILDLVITNNAETVHSIVIEKTILSDHDMLKTNLISDKFTQTKHEEIYKPENPFDKLNLHKANWEKIKKEIGNLHWKEELEGKSVDEICEHINMKVSEAATRYCTAKSKFTKVDIPRERRSLIRTRRHIISNINFLKYVKSVKSHHEQEVRDERIKKLQEKVMKIEEDIKKSVEAECKRKEDEAIEKIKLNPRAFYSYANRKRKLKCKIGPLIDSNGNLQSDPKTMADILQQQYVKVFSEEDNDSDNHMQTETDSVNNTISDIEFSEHDIIKAIDAMPARSAPGPDKFPVIILKKCKQELALPLYILWRKSLDTSVVPNIHKLQTIVPIFKKDSKGNPANYRPVSLTSHILKLFERILRGKVVNFIEENGLLSKDQYGFRPGRSTISQLIVHIDKIIEILEKNQNADVLYLDFAKAFDKVCHKTLLNKLEGFGITGKILDWFKSFLSERYQRVIVQGKLSEPEKVKSGVPQGTVLGPILFILYINNITEVLKSCAIKIFADDSKLIKAMESEEDRIQLLEDLIAVIKWADDNKMQLNETKFMLVQRGKNENLKQPYRIDENTMVEQSEYVKDLGILVDWELKWRQHIATTTTSASQLTGWVLRVFQNRSMEVMLTLFKALIRPKLEYGCMVFHPHQIGDIIKLESIQRTLTHRIENMSEFNYWERLEKLGLFSLQRRRERYICIHMFKIYMKIISNDIGLQFYETSRHGPKCRRKKLTAKSTSVNSLRCNSFSDIGARLFNILPKKIKEAKTKQSFKHKLDKLLVRLPDRPPTPGYARQNDNSIWDWLRSEASNMMDISDDEEEDTLEPRVVEQRLLQPTS